MPRLHGNDVDDCSSFHTLSLRQRSSGRPDARLEQRRLGNCLLLRVPDCVPKIDPTYLNPYETDPQKGPLSEAYLMREEAVLHVKGESSEL